MKVNIKQLVIFGFSLLFSVSSLAKIDNDNDLAINNPIQSTIDLTSIVDDKAPVIMNPGRFMEDEVIYRMPRVIQGSYEVSDFGNYIEGFMAFDYEGKELKSEKIDTNSWVIYDANQSLNDDVLRVLKANDVFKEIPVDMLYLMCNQFQYS